MGIGGLGLLENSYKRAHSEGPQKGQGCPQHMVKGIKTNQPSVWCPQRNFLVFLSTSPALIIIYTTIYFIAKNVWDTVSRTNIHHRADGSMEFLFPLSPLFLPLHFSISVHGVYLKGYGTYCPVYVLSLSFLPKLVLLVLLPHLLLFLASSPPSSSSLSA